ncbi:hypothetical protein ACE939_15120 [Aquimarina sp. W85]|uniref:hypothetical protein n=1 Tax=Aquimarina rhodophyticola TaxID=3342246 RepID=UPI0036724981
MKKHIFLFSFIFILHFGFSQEFKPSTDYKINKAIVNTPDGSPSYILSLTDINGTLKDVSPLTITDTELYEEVFVSTLENPGLEGVREIVKLEVEYYACCAHVDAFYYMIKDDATIVEIPKLQNVYCEGTNSDYRYIFPNQDFGIEGNVLKTKVGFNNDSSIQYVSLKESYAVVNDILTLKPYDALTSN